MSWADYGLGTGGTVGSAYKEKLKKLTCRQLHVVRVSTERAIFEGLEKQQATRHY